MHRALVLLDTDFDGARLSAVCAAHGGRRLHYIALAPRPVDARHLPEQWRAQWPPCLPGLHRMVSHDGLVTLDVLIGEADACLAQLSAQVDEVHLAWVPAATSVLARLMADGARLQAVHLDEAQRMALQKHGFVFDESRLRAMFYARRGESVSAVVPERRAIVIGAGVAGAAACERLAARGWKVTLVERHAQPASEASGASSQRANSRGYRPLAAICRCTCACAPSRASCSTPHWAPSKAAPIPPRSFQRFSEYR